MSSNSGVTSRGVVKAIAAVFWTFGAVHTAGAVTYTGYALARDNNPLNPQTATQAATTPVPASYEAIVGNNQATSTTDSAAGGSVYVSAQSQVVQFPAFGFSVSGQAGANTQLNYTAVLTGPDTPVVVPVRVQASGFIASAGAASGHLNFVVNYDSGGSSGQLSAYRVVDGTGSADLSFDQIVYFKVGAPFQVLLSVDGAAGFLGAELDGSLQAFLDPTFTIADPTIAALYHFEGVPGVTPAVPEPAPWALAMLGLAAVGAARRRAR